ncbi:MAG: hypothetical protein KTR17_07410 [Cellvibrionaceae bacterium]|nr:hypothetical protein [Cellvibrionaceae bacterium]
MILESYELAKAVVFFHGHRIVKSMLFSEFEAILDGYVPVIEFAGKRCEAAYVEINVALEVCTAVFFRVTFGRKGEVDSAWNLPIDQLAAMADPVPDTALGYFRLVCYSQCPINYFQDYLWEPDFAKGKRQLRALQHFTKDNRLAIRFRHAAGDSGPDDKRVPLLSVESSYDDLADPERRLDDLKAQLKSMHVQGVLAKKESEALITKLKNDHERRITEYRALFTEKDRQVKALRESNQSLKDAVDEKHKKLLALRHYYEQKLAKVEGHEKELADSLYENFEKEMQLVRQADLKDYRQRLKMRDTEIQHCKDKEIVLKQEVVTLRQQNEALTKGKGIELLQDLLAKGCRLVKFQSGCEYVNIPIEDIDKFLGNVQAYVAARYGISEAQYQGWERHYKAPVCVAVNASGQFCGDGIERCENPSDFQWGVSDRCNKHKVFGKFGKCKAVSA